MKFILLLICSIVSISAQTNITLAWDPVPETNVAGYHLLLGTKTQTFSITNTILGRTNTLCTVSNFPAGKLFFVVTAFSDDGIESDWSNEVSYTNKAFKPKNLRMSVLSSQDIIGPWKEITNYNIVISELLTNNQFYVSKLNIE